MLAPFNLQQWIDDNRDLLKPPVSNKNLYKEAGDFIVMVVAGPNARKDYHYNEGEEPELPHDCLLMILVYHGPQVVARLLGSPGEQALDRNWADAR